MKYNKGHPIIYHFEEILSPIADELIIANIKMPVTIIYSSLEMCGVGYAFLERKLGDHQFYPIGAPQIPQNRLFAQFHSPQTDKMKHELISSIVSESCKQRVIAELHARTKRARAWAEPHC